ncbi:hypothetical protein WICPIJ_006125 [Wickerhamomyces pijperi]|uniref:Bul1 N-terminal domain-containing protein n=1 Tax=Wickerhamomyces pijperi TaxID=599730 RepID=A0A9P8TLB4_WICPI|nr:hypothetical protein WICPIJ_006125 [Wickerhamomyces pijperi]
MSSNPFRNPYVPQSEGLFTESQDDTDNAMDREYFTFVPNTDRNISINTPSHGPYTWKDVCEENPFAVGDTLEDIDEEETDEFDNYLSSLTTMVKITHDSEIGQSPKRVSDDISHLHHFHHTMKPNSSYGSYLEQVRNNSISSTQAQAHSRIIQTRSSPTSSETSTFSSNTPDRSSMSTSIDSSSQIKLHNMGSMSVKHSFDSNVSRSASTSTLGGTNRSLLLTETSTSSVSHGFYSTYLKLPSLGSKSQLKTTLTFIETSTEQNSNKKTSPSSILKQYTNGDHVHAQISIANDTDIDTRFEDIAIWLEGCQYVISDRTSGVVTKRVFLRVDSNDYTNDPNFKDNSTCFLETAISNISTSGHSSTGGTILSSKKSKTVKIPLTEYFSEPQDGVIKAQSVYTFQVHFYLPERELPPTLSLFKHKKYGTLEVDDDLKYGFVYNQDITNGSPVLVDDLSYDEHVRVGTGDTAIQYTVNCLVIGHERNFGGNQAQNLNALKRLSTTEAFIRFVPYDQRSDETWRSRYSKKGQNSLSAWFDLKGRVHDQLESRRLSVRDRNSFMSFKSLDVNTLSLPSSVSAHCLYQAKGISQNRDSTNNKPAKASKYLNKLLQVKSSISSGSFGSSDKSQKSKQVSHGVISASFEFLPPWVKLRYCTPNVFEKVNQWYSATHSNPSNLHALRTLDASSKPAVPGNSDPNIEELQEIKIDLRYNLSSKPAEVPLGGSQHNRSTSLAMPQVESVKVYLVAIDYHTTESDLPFVISPELLIDLNSGLVSTSASTGRKMKVSPSKSDGFIDEDLTYGLKFQAQKMLSMISTVRSDTQTKQELPQSLVQELQTLSTITAKSRPMPTPLYDFNFAATEATQTQWVPANANIGDSKSTQCSYHSKLSIPLTNPLFTSHRHKLKQIIPPNYQLGLAGRCYILRCYIKFDSSRRQLQHFELSKGKNLLSFKSNNHEEDDIVLDIPVRVGLW